MTTPVSLPLTTTLPAPGSTILPPSITSHLPTHTIPSLPPSTSSTSHSRTPSLSTPLLQNNANTTRILLLSNFSSELKTKDICTLFGEWEDERGGFKIKWSDDESCWIVFNDAAVAKRAFLTLLSSPPPALSPSSTHTPKLTPYVGPDVPQILSAVQNRPRSRSNTMGAGGGHSRKGSLAGSGGGTTVVQGHQRGGSGNFGRSGSIGGGGGAGGGRGSYGQKQLRELMDGQGQGQGGANGGGGAEGEWEGEGERRERTPPVPGLPSGYEREEGEGRRSPETSWRVGGSPVGHRKSESRSGADAVASAVEGLTINE